VAYAVEDSYLSLPGSPTWKQPGLDIEVSSASLENALIRARHPDTPLPQGSRAGNLEGAYNISFSQDKDQDFHELIFPKSSNTQLASGADTAPTAAWYLSADAIDQTEERFLGGAAVESVTWNYNQGQKNTVDLTVIYGDEPEVGGSYGSAPGSISQPAKDDIVMWHETDFQIDGVSVSKLQSLSLTIAGLSRFRRGQQREPVDAVVGAYEPTLSVQATLSDNTQQQLAYGSSTAVEPLDSIAETNCTLIFDIASNLNVIGVQPNSFDWAQLVNEEDVQDPTEYHVKEVSVA
jgi:hypothetical protein